MDDPLLATRFHEAPSVSHDAASAPLAARHDARSERASSLASASAEATPTLTVIVPVFNEVRTIDEAIRRTLTAPCSKQVIVVDDGSTDGTRDVLAAWRDNAELTILCHDRNRGKGAAIRTALEHAVGRFTIIQDADLECVPEDYPRLLEPLLSGRAQVVYGSRFLQPANAPQRFRVFRLGVSVLNWFVRFLYGVRLTDEATCFKVFPTEVLRSMDLRCKRFEFCPEVTAKACRLGLAITEVPVYYCPRDARAGKKIRVWDGMVALATLWRLRKWQPGR